MMSTYDQPARFTVTGRGDFPMDMLRHDRCWPASEIDAGRMFQPLQPGARRRDRVIEMEAQAERGITPRRWASFGWTVREINGEEVML